MSVVTAHIYVHHMHTWCLQRSERVLELLELELEMVVSHHVGAGNLLLWKNSKCASAKPSFH